MKDAKTIVAQIQVAYLKELKHKIAERQRRWEKSEALYLSAQLENEAYDDLYGC